MASTEESCSKGLKDVLANTVRGVALAVWGTQPRDRMLIAEMSVSASIGELVQAEKSTKQELSMIVERVRATQLSKSKSGLKDLLLKSRVLRGTLSSINKKRVSMEKQLETLRQSQLNQHMLVSMKHTSEALQTMGMKVNDADNIMLDLEEWNSDINALQYSLSSSFVDDNMTETDLIDELPLILSDDSLEPKIHRAADANKHSKKTTESRAEQHKPTDQKTETEHTQEQKIEAQEQTIEAQEQKIEAQEQQTNALQQTDTMAQQEISQLDVT
jgi:hypothetical protein